MAGPNEALGVAFHLSEGIAGVLPTFGVLIVIVLELWNFMRARR